MRKYIKGGFLVFVLLFLYLPIFILAVYSFTKTVRGHGLGGFDMR